MRPDRSLKVLFAGLRRNRAEARVFEPRADAAVCFSSQKFDRFISLNTFISNYPNHLRSYTLPHRSALVGGPTAMGSVLPARVRAPRKGTHLSELTG